MFRFPHPLPKPFNKSLSITTSLTFLSELVMRIVPDVENETARWLWSEGGYRLSGETRRKAAPQGESTISFTTT